MWKLVIALLLVAATAMADEDWQEPEFCDCCCINYFKYTTDPSEKWHAYEGMVFPSPDGFFTHKGEVIKWAMKERYGKERFRVVYVKGEE